MAYARFFNSDIYIYPHVEGHIECCACWLNEDKDQYSLFIGNVKIINDDQLKAHLEAHVREGHDIPEMLYEQILADPDRYGNSSGYGRE